MGRHQPRRLPGWMLALAMALPVVAGPASALAATTTAKSKSYSVAVVKVTVREPGGKVFRAKARAVRVGDSVELEVVSDLHRHALVFAADGGEDLAFSYDRDGGRVKSGAMTLGAHGGSTVVEHDGHRVEITVIPTRVTVGVE